jgi:hypothetical protein
MTPRQKLKIRFIINSSIIFIGLILLLFLCKYNPEIINEKWLFWSAMIIGFWFWFDKKLLYVRNQLIICLFLCLTFLFIVTIFTHLIYFATIPLASMIGRVMANRILEKWKVRKIDLDVKDELEDMFEEKAKMMIYFLATAIISGVIYLIIQLIIFCLYKFNILSELGF